MSAPEPERDTWIWKPGVGLVSAVAIVAAWVAIGVGVPTPGGSPTPTPTATASESPTATPTSTATATATPTPTPPPEGVANIWIAPGAGTCTGGRSSTPISYEDAASPDRRCGTIDAAWDAMSAGDTARMVAGTYSGLQNVTGNKASETFVIGEDRDTVIIASGGSSMDCSQGDGGGFNEGHLCLNANNMTFENFTSDAGSAHGQSKGWRVGASNITTRNARAVGEYVSVYVAGPNYHWDGGIFGEDGVRGQRHCATGDGEPIWIEDTGDDAVIENLYFYPQGSDQTPHACSSNGFHLEHIRVQGTSGVTIRNVYFEDGGEAGSGHIFFSGSGACCDHTLEGIYFGRNDDGSTSMQAHANLGTCSGWVLRHNYFAQGQAMDCSESGWTVHANSGAVPTTGTHTLNIPFSGGSGTDYSAVGNRAGLGLDEMGRPESGSVVIDKGSSTCSTLPFDLSVTFDVGVERPQGSSCDVGPFEYAG